MGRSPADPVLLVGDYVAYAARAADEDRTMKYLEASAEISDDGLHRYWLSRRLSMGERTVLFIGVNPSTADGKQDDPTVRREVGFARAWGFDWYLKGNIYAYRATKTKDLRAAAQEHADLIYGPLNQDALKWMVEKAEVVVAAWGAEPLDCYGSTLAGWILSLEHTRCLGQNKDGSPKHPLYLPKNTQLLPMPRGDVTPDEFREVLKQLRRETEFRQRDITELPWRPRRV